MSQVSECVSMSNTVDAWRKTFHHNLRECSRGETRRKWPQRARNNDSWRRAARPNRVHSASISGSFCNTNSFLLNYHLSIHPPFTPGDSPHNTRKRGCRVLEEEASHLHRPPGAPTRALSAHLPPPSFHPYQAEVRAVRLANLVP